MTTALPLVLRHLFAAGLVSPHDLLSPGSNVVALSRRNDNSLITAGGARIFFKQARDEDAFATLEHEHAALGLIEKHLPAVRGIPRPRHVDRAERWIAIELLPTHETLADRLRRARRPARTALAMAGRALGEVHAAVAIVEMRGPGAPPDVRSFVEPAPGDYAEFSPCTAAFVGAAQASSIAAGLLAIEQVWRPDGPTHGDLRWENIVVGTCRRARPERMPLQSSSRDRGWIVDWEFLGLGDRRWDLGCFLGDALFALITGLDTADERPPDLAASKVPLGAVAFTVATFLEAYRSARTWTPGAEDRAAIGQFAVFRLFGRFHERSKYREELDRQSVLALQACETLLAKPDSALALFGV
jgi:phosphotransferase family enzyme